VQGPIRLGRQSEPQPDVAVVRFRRDFYRDGHPAPEDVLLVIEVAETSLDYDRGVKLALYASARIAGTWIVDLVGGRVETYTGPSAEGYRQVARAERGARVAPAAFPDVQIAVDDIVG
jgi:Uma2 family endonuclease